MRRQATATNPNLRLHFLITMEEVGGVVDRALYGGKKGQQGFGNALYEIKEEKRKGCNYRPRSHVLQGLPRDSECPTAGLPCANRHVAGTWV